VITPFTRSLGDGDDDLMPAIYAILLSDVWLSPLLRLIDIVSNLKKHVLAPRAKTQDEMNLNFQGTFYNLGERYTVSFFFFGMQTRLFATGCAAHTNHEPGDIRTLPKFFLSSFSTRHFFPQAFSLDLSFSRTSIWSINFAS
jgi:hypothetical protein